jgi:hypothetical protein
MPCSNEISNKPAHLSARSSSGNKWLVETFDGESIKYLRTEKRTRHSRADSAMDDRHPHYARLICEADKYHMAANFVGTFLTMSSTAAFTPRYIPTAPRLTAPSRSGSPIPIHRCN